MKSLHDWTGALDRVLELVVLLDDDMTKGLADYGLTPARAHLVWRLHHGGPATQRVLADALKVTPRNVHGARRRARRHRLRDAGAASHRPPRDAGLADGARRPRRCSGWIAATASSLARTLFGDMPERQLAAFTGGLEHVVSRLRAAIGAGAGAPP